MLQANGRSFEMGKNGFLREQAEEEILPATAEMTERAFCYSVKHVAGFSPGD